MNNTEANNYFESMINGGQKPLHAQLAQQLQEQAEEKQQAPSHAQEKPAAPYTPRFHDVNAALCFNQ